MSLPKRHSLYDKSVRMLCKFKTMILAFFLVIFVFTLVALMSNMTRESDVLDSWVSPTNETLDVKPSTIEHKKPQAVKPSNVPLVKSLPWNEIRLPTWIQPFHYDLSIETHMENFTFYGHVQAHFTLTNASKFIVFHAAELDMTDISLVEFQQSNAMQQQNSHQLIHHEQFELWILLFHRVIEPGNWTLSIHYNGTLNDSLRGYYRAKLKDSEEPNYIATTQFEPTDARRAFPCFDEPLLKATFSIQLSASKKFHALSNMPIQQVVSLNDETSMYTFEKTRHMSTYLVAFIISNFESISKVTDSNIQVSIWTQKDQSELGKYALDVAVHVLNFYEKTFGIPYPLPKSDLIAIPDFAAGAMENWGLITFRDSALLYNSTSSTAMDKQRIAQVIAHELAHQWFGNLVTMEWWSDLWLNEGFAEFMEYKGTDASEKNWFMDEQFVYTENMRALRADQSAFTHAIATHVNDPTEIQEIFDDISYGKGAAILRMLQDWLEHAVGSSHFFDSLKVYLESHAFSNAKTNDLWTALSSKVNVKSVMSTWTDQAGYPVIIVDGATVSQERFYYSVLVPPNELEFLSKEFHDSNFSDMHRQVWKVPIIYREYSLTQGSWTASSPKTFTLNSKGPEKVETQGGWILANAGRSGVYRVQYPVETYRQASLLLEANGTFLPPADRLGLLTDAFALVQSGRIKDVQVALNLTRFLMNETDSVVWWGAISELNAMESSLVLSSCFAKFEEFYLKFINRLIHVLGWTESHPEQELWHIRALLRAQALRKAISLQDAEAKSFALAKFKEIRQGQGDANLSVDVIGVIYQAAARWGTEEDFEWLLSGYFHSSFAPEKLRFLTALASVHEPHLQIRTLDLVLKGHLRKQDMIGLINSVATLSPLGHLYTWNWLRSNWDALMSIWKGSDFTRFNDMLQSVISRFTLPVLVQEAQDLFLLKKDANFFVPPRSKLSVSKGLEIAKQRIQWLKLQEEDVEQWLHQELNKMNGLLKQ